MRILLFAALALSATACVSVRSSLVTAASDFEPKTPGAAAETLKPAYTERDVGRPKIPVKLTLVASGLKGPTDIQPVPGEATLAVVLGKNGETHLVDLADGKKKKLFTLAVDTDSEQGLLGLAFHPKFRDNRRFFVAYSPTGGSDRNRVAAWIWPKGGTPKEKEVLLDIEDPYPNHNGGQLVFGPDGYLYVGTGDGGWMNDPHGNGQNLDTLLGKMLRLDVDAGATKERAYGIPKDNPFVGKTNVRPEIWAYGLRNPWRYTFAPDGRLVVADVGQGSEEEVGFLEAGENGGWKTVEGFRCFDPEKDCKKKGTRLPIVTYGRDDGFSITGGYVQTAATPAALKGWYLFADYAFGRIWAIELPASDGKVKRDGMTSLGQFPLTISTFGRDALGRVYVAGFDQGAIYRIDAP